MEIVSSEVAVYIPEFNPQTNKYQDKCPFEKRKAGSKMVCHCRHQDDVFNTVSQFNAHIKHQFHKDWVNAYDKYDHDGKNEMIAELEKDRAIMYADLEKQQNRAERHKRKYKEMENKYGELVEEYKILKQENEQLKMKKKELIDIWSAIEMQISHLQTLYE